MCKLPKIVPCGRNTKDRNAKYPYCRPMKRINKNTPKTAFELSKKEILDRCKRKQANPKERII